MRNQFLLTLIMSFNLSVIFSQSNDVITKRFPITSKDDLLYEPLVMKGSKGETIFLYLKSMAILKTPSLLTVVIDDKLNKIYEKETTVGKDFFKLLGEMRGKTTVTMDRFQAVDFGDEFGLFYERSTDLAYFTLSKKDYSIKKNNEIELDTKVPITTFSRDRSIIKAFPYKDLLYVLFAGKEDNELTVATVKKSGQVDYKMLKVPQIRLDKGNGKSKDVEFMKYDEFEWKNDSLFTFIYQTDNDSKYFHTIILNVEQMKTRIAKYTYPSVGNAKDGDIYRGAFMLNDKVFLSSVNAEKCVISIKNKSTGEEIKSLSFKNGGKNPYQNTDIINKEAQYVINNAPNPRNIKVEPANLEKFWKKFMKGGNDGNIGAVLVETLDTFYRVSIGYQDDRYNSYSSTSYVNMIHPNQPGNPGAVGTRAYTTTSSYFYKNSSLFYSYFDKKLEHIPTQKKSAFEDATEKVELKNSGFKARATSMKMFKKLNVDYFVYFDNDTNEIVLMGSKK